MVTLEETIDLENTSENRGREKSHRTSLNRQAVLENSSTSGRTPFLSEKNNITEHPNFRFHSDADPKLAFSQPKEFNTNRKLLTDQAIELCDESISRLLV